ncbi:hypothetical protein P0M11_11485 [Kaistella sp. PBT33-4]|uniref:hypothetical protein n=1 Tax=Kaistella sp. PBT33-4 TaxID=3032000 RepID=UPI0023D7BD76|nr:hypothetical protein [Kaistella sp. PBT33-4]MDF0720620.1 hypothetical protein [Kaistella sp. PBT33-4]
MNTNKLISTTAFVLQHKTKPPTELAKICVGYATLLASNLDICMLVPVLRDEIFEYPVRRDYSNYKNYIIDLHTYQRLEQEVLFSGFDADIMAAYDIVHFNREGEELFWFKSGKFYGKEGRIYTVEDLLFVPDIELTEAALRKISLCALMQDC